MRRSLQINLLLFALCFALLAASALLFLPVTRAVGEDLEIQIKTASERHSVFYKGGAALLDANGDTIGAEGWGVNLHSFPNGRKIITLTGADGREFTLIGSAGSTVIQGLNLGTLNLHNFSISPTEENYMQNMDGQGNPTPLDLNLSGLINFQGGAYPFQANNLAIAPGAQVSIRRDTTSQQALINNTPNFENDVALMVSGGMAVGAGASLNVTAAYGSVNALSNMTASIDLGAARVIGEMRLEQNAIMTAKLSMNFLADANNIPPVDTYAARARSIVMNSGSKLTYSSTITGDSSTLGGVTANTVTADNATIIGNAPLEAGPAGITGNAANITAAVGDISLQNTLVQIDTRNTGGVCGMESAGNVSITAKSGSYILGANYGLRAAQSVSLGAADAAGSLRLKGGTAAVRCNALSLKANSETANGETIGTDGGKAVFLANGVAKDVTIRARASAAGASGDDPLSSFDPAAWYDRYVAPTPVPAIATAAEPPATGGDTVAGAALLFSVLSLLLLLLLRRRA